MLAFSISLKTNNSLKSIKEGDSGSPILFDKKLIGMITGKFEATNSTINENRFAVTMLTEADLLKDYLKSLSIVFSTLSERTIQLGELTYKGEIKYGMPHGKGKVIRSGKIIEEGCFRNGVEHGLILKTKPNNEKWLYEYMNGIVKTKGLYFDDIKSYSCND